MAPGSAAALGLLLSLLVLPCPAASVAPPPVFTVRASTLYDAGFQHGHLAKARIRSWFQTCEMRSVFAFADGIGKARFEAMRNLSTALYPGYARELDGLATGAGVDIDQVWGINMISELENYPDFQFLPSCNVSSSSSSSATTAHCTDVYSTRRTSNATSSRILGHNEDWGVAVQPLFYYLQYLPVGEDPEFSACAGLIYPGSMLGWAVTWAAKGGLFTTQNTLFPKDPLSSGGVMLAFAQRHAVCEAASLEDALRALKSAAPYAGGASVNMVDAATGDAASVEIRMRHVSVVRVGDGNYSHMNLYKHAVFEGTDTGTDAGSTEHRQARLDALPVPTDAADVMARLSDTADAAFPIFRIFTLATHVFESATCRLRIWCCGMPADAGPPTYDWDLAPFFLLGKNATRGWEKG